jgi:hypothetical protein
MAVAKSRRKKPDLNERLYYQTQGYSDQREIDDQEYDEVSGLESYLGG